MKKQTTNISRMATLFALVVTTCAAMPFHASAQAPAPDASEVSETRMSKDGPQEDTEPTSTLIVKFRDAEAVQVLDTPATMRAATTAGVAVADIAPMHTLSALAMKTLDDAAGVALTHVREMSGEAHVLRLPTSMSHAQAQAIADRLAQLSTVEYAVPSHHFHALSIPANAHVADTDVTPNDPQYAQQWHYSAPVAGSMGANLPAAWDIITGSASIVVAVVDTGARFDHPDLAGRFVTGYDFISDVTVANDVSGRDADATDPGDWVEVGDSCYSAVYGPESSSWHGSHVAGTIGAATNNGVGVAGINWVSKILPVRVLGKCGNDDPDIIDGLRWAAGLSVPGVPANATPARVLNMSLGGGGVCNALWKTAINEIYTKGVVVVVAAGNSASTSADNQTPASCPHALTVAATNRNGVRASYSSWGSSVEISGPGGETSPTTTNGVLSTLNAGTKGPTASIYEWYQGTSMATPHVAGIVSLMLSINPNLNPAQVVSILQSTATAFPSNGGKCDANALHSCGAGIINAGAAVAAAKTTPGITFKNVYLPLAIQQTSGSGGGGLLKNGDFEQGPGVSWTAISSADPTDSLVYEDGLLFLDGVHPHAGSWASWMGGYGSGKAENATLRQSVTVPAGAPYLVYYQIIDSNEANCANDFARVLVNGAPVAASQTGICSSTQTYPNWVRKSLNLSAYAGKAVTLEFNFQADASKQTIASSWLLDDIAFSATP